MDAIIVPTDGQTPWPKEPARDRRGRAIPTFFIMYGRTPWDLEHFGNPPFGTIIEAD